MKASELITLLQDAIDKYGDLPLSNDDSEIGETPKLDFQLTPMDEVGSRNDHKPTEFFFEVFELV